jgi:hypothetical protein
MLWKKKEFEDLEEDLLVSFERLYFIIAGDNLYISTMYYLNICSIIIVKKKKKETKTEDEERFGGKRACQKNCGCCHRSRYYFAWLARPPPSTSRELIPSNSRNRMLLHPTSS